MKAIIQDRYGSPDALEITEIDPPARGDDEVLVRVRAASVHADVWHAMSGSAVRPAHPRFRAAQAQEPRPRN